MVHSPIHSLHAMHVQTGWTMGSGLLAVVAGKALMSVGVVTVPLVTLPLMMGTSIVIGGASSQRTPLAAPVKFSAVRVTSLVSSRFTFLFTSPTNAVLRVSPRSSPLVSLSSSRHQQMQCCACHLARLLSFHFPLQITKDHVVIGCVSSCGHHSSPTLRFTNAGGPVNSLSPLPSPRSPARVHAGFCRGPSCCDGVVGSCCHHSEIRRGPHRYSWHRRPADRDGQPTQNIDAQARYGMTNTLFSLCFSTCSLVNTD
jgi:hypothetical protein